MEGRWVRGAAVVTCPSYPAPRPPLTTAYRLLRIPVASVLAQALLWASCAIISSPKGGLVDERGPVLDTLASTPNLQLDARPEEIVLEFDEYVVLKDASRNVVLTPTPESGRPSFFQRGRRVEVDLSEVVYRDSTTYQLQFGNAIRDLNEGNPAEALRYVFSTGAYLDSLTLRGRVVDQVTGEPVAGALAGLYRSREDTGLTRTPPDYFALTDSAGRFLLDYLSPGTYRLAAYGDEDRNYRLNEGEEALAFLPAPVTVAADAPDTTYTLVSSATYAPLRVLRGEQLHPGYLRLTLNRPDAADEVTVGGLPGEIVARFADGDTLFLAYAPPLDTLRELLVARDTLVDTVRLRRNVAEVAPAIAALGRPRAVPGEAAQSYGFNVPLAGVDPDSIRVLVDSAEVAKGRFGVSPDDPRRLRWAYPSDTVAAYELILLPGALTGVHGEGLATADTLRLSPKRNDQFGELTLTLAGLDAGGDYVAEVLASGGEAERILRLGAVDTTETVILRRLPPGEYTVRLTDDADGDGRTSPGDLRRRTPPERVRVYAIEQVRADWTVEQVIVVE